METPRTASVHPRSHLEPPRVALLPWITLALVLGLAWYFRGILMLMGAAVALAWVLAPAVDWLHARKVPRPLAILAVLLLVGVVATALLWIAVPDIVEHLTQLLATVPTRIQQDWLPRANNALVWLRRRTHLRIPTTTDAWIGQLASRASSVAQGSLSVVASAASLSIVIVEKAVELLIVLALSFYTLSSWHGLLDGVTDLVPVRARDRVLTVVGKVDRVLGRFVRGQFQVMGILGTFFAIGLDRLHVPAGLGLGIFAGLIAFIPYLGFFIALGLAMLLASLDTTGQCSVGAVAGFMVLIHLLDILVVTPRILGGSIGLSPVVVIISLLAGAQALGFMGLLVAVPAAAVLKVLLDELVDWYKSTRFYGLAPVHTLHATTTLDSTVPAPRLTAPPDAQAPSAPPPADEDGPWRL